jgi:hypothetical protein
MLPVPTFLRQAILERLAPGNHCTSGESGCGVTWGARW